MLELNDLTVGYGDTLVLRDVNLTVPESKVVALLGPNGAGKTTLLRAACGFLRPTRGSVVLRGEDITSRAPDDRARRGICLIPEGRGVFPSLSVKENILMFAPPDRRRESLDRAITAFPILGERLAQSTASLSGGEQQMLAVVRAYVTEPLIVLVDEASMGLAPLVVDRLFDFLARLAATGTSLLLVEQYVSRALALADHVYVLNHGRIVFSGSSGEIGGHQDIVDRYLGSGMGPRGGT